MRTLLSNLTRPLAHVVHIGAGAGGCVSAWREAGARTITLIEGDPGIAEQLKAQIGAHDGVSVVQAVVSGDIRERTFRRMNFPNLNSLRAPTGLKELFPGLKTLSQEQVQPVDPARLIASLDLPDAGADEGSNLLVIEAPGEALGILKALAAADLLLQFDMIQLTEARAPLYNKAPPAADILTYLVEAGFRAGFEDDPLDPEQPCLTARLERATLTLAEADTEIEGLRAELTRAQGKFAQVSDQLADAQREVAQRAKLATEQAAQIETLEVALKEARAVGESAARPLEDDGQLQPRANVRRPFIIAAAGVPRSGSTWVYNACRFLCEKADLSCYAVWWEDYAPETHADYDIHLVKLHSVEDLPFTSHRILTTHRNLVDRLASLLHMGWLQDDPQEIRRAAESQADLDSRWASRSSCETQYDDIVHRPQHAVLEIARVLGITCDDATADAIALQLDQMSAPKAADNEHNHDPLTLLHPNHRATESQRKESQSIIRAALAGGD